MADRFRSPKSKEEETSLVSDATPKATQYNTKWGMKVFEEWQQQRPNKLAMLEHVGVAGLKREDVQDLTVNLEHMLPNTLNFWLCKFVCEVAKKNGERYPPKTLYLLICAINRHLSETGGENALNVLNKADKRFAWFRKVLDGEMKDATKCGIAQKCKMDAREQITEDEEAILWEKGLLGGHSAESLMYTIYFYNGKIFGLRAGEHRLLRLCNISVQENLIIFDESWSKTFHGGLKDLQNKPRFIQHKCHDTGSQHNRCLAALYSVYISKVQDFAESVESFYFRPHRNGKFEYERSAVGLCTLNKILPDKLCQKANLPRKTAHCLRVTCATRMFQHSVEEKLARERTGHKSNALFSYQKASEKQLDDVSNVLGPVSAPKETEYEHSSVKGKLSKPREHVQNDIVDFDCKFDLSDDVLASIVMPENSFSSNINNFCASSVFNNCNINFWYTNK